MRIIDMKLGIDFQGTIKAYRTSNISRARQGTESYKVVVFRGTEENLINRIGNIKELISFCDNGYKFDLPAKHYGGHVEKGYVEYKKKPFSDELTPYFVKSNIVPEGENYKPCYFVDVYTD